MEDLDVLIQGVDSPLLKGSLVCTAALIAIVSVICCIVSLVLSIAYVKYNRKKNGVHMNGERIARYILEENGLFDIKIKVSGSLLFGNSYSHHFKKIRLRRKTIKKDSIASLAMGSQKASLAVLDKENDPDMQKRVKLVPIMTFGPIAFIPIVAIGFLLDLVLFNAGGVVSFIVLLLGLAFYVLSAVMTFLTIKTEKKAREKALEFLIEKRLVNEEESEMIQKLFKLYNIEYVNNFILSMLELLYYVLRLVAMFRGNSSSGSSKK